MAASWRYLDSALVERLSPLELSARSVVGGTTLGLHKSRMKGASVEFRQHRAYVPGDEPRRLDWRVLAKTQRPFIKEYDEETNLRCMLLVDGSGSMRYQRQYGRKFDAAAKLAAAMAYLMLRQAESVGLHIAQEADRQWISPRNSSVQLSHILDHLERCEPQGETHLPQKLHEVSERLERRSLLIVLSDFICPLEPLQQGLAHLRHDRHEVLALQVLDPDEEEFPFDHWARFRGLEEEPPILVEPAALRRVYQANFAAHQRQLRSHCQSLKIHQATYRTDHSLGDWLAGLLTRRSSTGA